MPVALAPVLGNPILLAAFGLDTEASLPDQASIRLSPPLSRAAFQQGLRAMPLRFRAPRDPLHDSVASSSSLAHAGGGLRAGAGGAAAAAERPHADPAAAHAGVEAAAAGGRQQVPAHGLIDNANHCTLPVLLRKSRCPARTCSHSSALVSPWARHCLSKMSEEPRRALGRAVVAWNVSIVSQPPSYTQAWMALESVRSQGRKCWACSNAF